MQSFNLTGQRCNWPLHLCTRTGSLKWAQTSSHVNRPSWCPNWRWTCSRDESPDCPICDLVCLHSQTKLRRYRKNNKWPGKGKKRKQQTSVIIIIRLQFRWVSRCNQKGKLIIKLKKKRDGLRRNKNKSTNPQATKGETKTTSRRQLVKMYTKHS